jgi:hypothetical protein
MEIAQLVMDVAPVLAATGGLLWNFSKKVTKIEAQMQALEHQVNDCKAAIEGNRQGRIEVFGVINNVLKVKDNEMSERLAKVETIVSTGITPAEVYTRLAKIEAELKTIGK